MIAWLTTDLPEPDSPTSATVERGRTRNDAPFTARIYPPGAAKRTCRSRTSSRSLTPRPSAIAAEVWIRRTPRCRAPADWRGRLAQLEPARRRRQRRALDQPVEPVDAAVEADRRARRRAAPTASSRRAVAPGRVIGELHAVELGPADRGGKRPHGGQLRFRSSRAGCTWRSAVRMPKSANIAANPPTIAVATGRAGRWRGSRLSARARRRRADSRRPSPTG